MRAVSGRTDRVVVVGAGLGGLSAALRLAGAGREVVVVEREPVPGGRAGLLELGGHRFDTGPTVLTMPEYAADALACVGERLADWVDLRPVRPAYRAFFPDGSTLDVHADVDAMAEEVARVCGPRDAAGYRRWVAFVTRLYRLQRDAFIDRNLDSPLDVLTPQLARLVAAGGFRRLAPTVASYVRDPRLRRVFSFQALYAGLAPQRALALYAVIAYMDTVAGVWFPVGGMHALPRGLAGAAARHGVQFRYRTEVARVVHDGERASGVLTTEGELLAADAVVVTADPPLALPELLGRPARRTRPSPSCVLLLVGSRAAYRRTVHHSLHFGRAWRATFDELTRRGRLMSDPSLLVSNPTATDPDLAPPGRHGYYVLAPTPALDAPLDWDVLGPRYRDELVATLEQRGYVGFGDAIEVERLTTPADWRRRGLDRGTPFAAAHTLRQTGPFRQPTRTGLANVVLAGSGTQPGVGVPMVLLSGRLAAERIVGAPLR